MPFGRFKKQTPGTEVASTAAPDLSFYGQTILSSSGQFGNLGLVGPQEKVSEVVQALLRELDSKMVPVYLLGTQQADADLLALPLTMPLNPVRAVPLPIAENASAAQLRDLLEDFARGTHRLSFGTQPAYLFVGRNLGPHWLTVLGRASTFKGQRVVVVADVSLQLKSRLQTLFSNFLVWPDERKVMERSLERIHRYDKPTPFYDTRWLNVGASLMSRQGTDRSVATAKGTK